MTADARITVVNRYALQAGVPAFTAAVWALARRVELEGHRGVLSYRFFATDGSEGRAVVVYASPEAWVGHHDIAMGWPEMAALRAAADLDEIAIHGPVSEAMRHWLEGAGLWGRVREHGPAVAGFDRG